MDSTNGIQENCRVVYGGTTVGKVSNVKLLPDLRIALTIKLIENFSLPAGSTFQVQTPLIGSSELVVNKSTATSLARMEDTLRGYADSVSILNLFNDSSKRKALIKIAEGIRELIEDHPKVENK